MEPSPIQSASELVSPPARRDWFVIPRLFIAAVLLLAAGLKIYQLSTEPLPGTGFWANPWVHLLEADCEIGLALWLLSGCFRRLAWLAALLCFAAFSCITASKFLAGEASCGCFGRVQVPPLVTLVLDLFIVLLLALLRPALRQRKAFSLARAAVFALLAAVVVGVTAIPVLRFKPVRVDGGGGSTTAPTGETVLLEPQEWAGKPLPKEFTDHIDIADELRRGEWLVAIVHDGCKGCEALVPALAAKARALPPGKCAKVALIHMRLHGESPLIPKDGIFLNGRLDESNDWFVETPAVMWLKDSVVTAAIVGKGEENRQKVLAMPLPVVDVADSEASLLLLVEGQEVSLLEGTKKVVFRVRNLDPKPLAITDVVNDMIELKVISCPKRVPAYSFGLIEVEYTRNQLMGSRQQFELKTDDPKRSPIVLKFRF